MVKAACQQHEERIALLEAEVAALCAERDAVSARYARLVAERDELSAKLEAALAKIVELTKQVFGSRSERVRSSDDQEQEQKDESGAEKSESEKSDDPGPAEAPEAKRKRGQQPGRPGHGRRSYEHLPSEELVHDPDPELLVCPICGAPYVKFDKERSEEIDLQVLTQRIVHLRPTYRRGCDCAQAKGIVAAPPPAKVIPKGRLSVGFLAHLVVTKFLLGLPVSRICAALSMEGADFAPSSLTGALRSLSPLLAPLAAAIRAHNAASGHLHMDETSWKVFEVIAGKSGYRWWCWIFVGDDSTAFVIKPGKGADVPAEHLGIDLDAEQPMLPGGATLLASSDFATCYQRLGREVEGFENSYCWSHIRRYFLRAGAAQVALQPWANGWVALVAKLFKTHRVWGATAPGSKEEADASAKVRAVVAEIDARRTTEAAEDDLPRAAKKVLATLDHEWDGLVTFLEHHGLPLDNNAAERGLRGPVVIRKNCYGSGASWSAELAADAWTIFATASQNHLNPLAHLRAYLSACAEAGGTAPERAALERFLPWAVSRDDRAGWADTS